MTDLPVRTDPRVLDADALAEARAADGVAWPDPASVCEAIRGRAPFDGPLPALDVLCEHPDERVPIALARHPTWRPPDAEGSVSAWRRRSALLYRRGVGEAREEGVVWTPLLDAMSQESLSWPHREEAFAAAGLDEAERPPLKTPEELLGALVPAIASTDDPEALAELLAFESAPLFRVLARHAPSPDPAFIERVMAAAPDDARGLVPAWAANPALPEAVARGWERAAVERITTPAGEPVRWPYGVGVMPNADGEAPRLLEGLLAGGHGVSEATIEALIEGLEDGGRGTWGSSRSIRRAFQALGEGVSDEQYRRALEAAPAWLRIEMVGDERATLEDQRWALEETSGQKLFELRATLVQIPAVRRDPACRAALVETTSADVLVPMLQDDDPVVREEAFQRMLVTNLSELIRLLQGNHPAVGRSDGEEGAAWLEAIRSDEAYDAIVERAVVSDGSAVLSLFTGVERAKRDLRVRRALAEARGLRRHDQWFSELVATSRDPEEFRRLFGTLIERDPRRAVELVEAGDHPMLRVLGTDERRALLTLDSHRLRQRAMLALGQLDVVDAEPTTPEPAPPARAGPA